MKCVYNMKKGELIEEVLRLRKYISDLSDISDFEICEELGISTDKDEDLMRAIRLGYMQGNLNCIVNSWRIE